MHRETTKVILNSKVGSPVLTVIITIRSASHYDMIGRLRHRLLDTRMPETISFMVIDEGSPQPDASRMIETCGELGFDYIRIDTEKMNFCAATARNIGACHARSKLIMHEDADLFPYPGYYQDLLDEIEIQGLHRHSNRFITVPAIYLTEDATAAALTGKLSKNAILHDHLTKGPMTITTLPASSAIIVNRMHYLAIGGYNEKFNGWGLEDLEYAYRLVRSTNTFLSPADHQWLIEGGYITHTAYRGWRAQFRMHGDLLMRKGIVTLHAHHAKDTSWRNVDQHSGNKALFKSSVQDFDAGTYSLPSLAAEERGKSLIFGKGTFAYNPSMLPLWGDLEVKGYQEFLETDIVQYIRENGITRVIFTNPYASELRLGAYRKVREAGIPYVVVERGALTDSMFIDDTGFCCESTRYRREHWPAVLDEGRAQRVREYIASEQASGTALEKQGDRIGARAALQKMGISPRKKILFVPFQSRSDTTVNFFAGEIGSFDNFVELVRDVTKRLPSNWVVVFKNHPLSSVKETIPGAIDIGDLHIKDTLELCDYVLLMNSGVGVLATLFNRPVIHASQAFYSDEGLNRSAATPDRVVSLLNEGFSVDQDARLRFISYLLEDFYSFGMFIVSERVHTDNARLTITDRIDYYRINHLGERVLDTMDNSRIVDIKAPIYDMFRESIINSRAAAKKPVSKPVVRPAANRSLADILVAAKNAFHSKNYAAAAALFGDAAKMVPHKATHFRERAEALAKAGDRRGAIEQLRKASAIAQNNKSIKRRIKELKRPAFVDFLATPFPIL